MIICDTGPLVAVLNRADAHHSRCVGLLEEHDGPLLVPGPVLTEVCYLLESRVGPAAEAKFLQSIVDGELDLVDLTSADLGRMIELVETYADFPLERSTPLWWRSRSVSGPPRSRPWIDGISPRSVQTTRRR